MAFFGFKDLDKLSEVDLAIYRFIVEHSEQVPFMRVREVAQGAHVSNSSVMRFIRKIGYDSFPEFKVSFRSENNELTDSQGEGIQIIDRDAFPADIDKVIKMSVNLMLDADNVIFLGIGASGAIAEYASRQASSLGFNSFAVKDPFYPLLPQVRNSANNILIVFSVSGKTTELVELLNDFTNDPDTEIISITGDIESTIARMSRYALTYHVPEERIHRYYDLTTQIPAMYIVETLLRELRHQEVSRRLI
ncbi:MurR/RpiR family transcriptional regulator [Companilactobacillus hulinensis]|uniref:MurR/RpiR family transcriptional regulator n=1 Tax=Companilactobacillus hulinensis TaxID=2486007 RepID=UPI000F7758A3|nr:MurR/RpiR family transcriptional regulator [Companilactobacillus hulinensis]